MVITLCGSTKFRDLFTAWDITLTLSGHAVFNLSPCSPDNEWEKSLLDRAHKSKIAHSDAIVLINHFAYIGESTLSEIEFAKERGKALYAIESWGKDCGIGANHKKTVQGRAASAGIYGKLSPIDTTYPKFKDAYSLLPEAGTLRSTLVKLIDEAGWWDRE